MKHNIYPRSGGVRLAQNPVTAGDASPLSGRAPSLLAGVRGQLSGGAR